MEYYKFNQSRCLVNLSNSILAHFGVKPFHHTLPELDEILKNHNKVAVVLFDGLNSYIKKELLNENDALIKHSNIEIDSVFPPTTVAATTAFLSGKFPYENGWLGWCQHFNDLNVTLEMFTNNYFKKEGKYHLQASWEATHLRVASLSSVFISARELLKFLRTHSTAVSLSRQHFLLIPTLLRLATMHSSDVKV